MGFQVWSPVSASGANRNGGPNLCDGGVLSSILSNGFALAFVMQIRISSFSADRPSCSVDPNHKVHFHGCYERYVRCDGSEKQDISRFLCVHCGRTISVLPDHFLPYRAASTTLVEQYFDAQANPGKTPESPVTEKEKGCLKRAWIHFGLRVIAIATVLGQMMQIRSRAPKPFWSALRRQGNLPGILLQLSKPFNTSLLGDYLCLRPWSKSTS